MMDIVRQQMSYKCFRIEGSKICNSDFYSNASISSTHASSNGQYSCPFIFSKNGAEGGGTHNKVLSDISKKIWDYSLSKGIIITAEYLPGALNKEADFQPRAVTDSSKWKLDCKVFQKICRRWELPDVDLFASGISHQVPTYMSWKLDPFNMGREAVQITWTHLKGYAFSPFALIRGALNKVQKEKATLLLITPAWQTQSWYPLL